MRNRKSHSHNETALMPPMFFFFGFVFLCALSNQDVGHERKKEKKKKHEEIININGD